MSKLLQTFDVIEEWDCDFRFSKEEILEWRHEPFYVFMLGQHIIQGRVNNNYRSDWMESNYYKRGKQRAFKPERRLNKPVLKRGMAFVGIKTPVERVNKTYVESFVRYKGHVLKVVMPKTRRVRFIPSHGMNYTIDAKAGPFLYNIRNKQFVFAWKKVAEDMPFDFTAMLMGKGEWPDRFKDIHLNFDSKWIVDSSIREYHFINYLLNKKRRSWAVYDDWIDFKALIAKKGTIY